MALTSSPRPRMRPDDLDTTPSSGGSNPQAREASGGGGKGGGMAESQDQITKSMNDKKWGYYDPYTGKQVPWYIDMINGGGKNAAGEDFSGGVGTIGLGGALANILGINPYGQDRDRTHSGANYWKGGDLDPSLLYQFGRPAGGGAGGMSSAPPARPQSLMEDVLMSKPINTSTYAEDLLMSKPVKPIMTPEEYLMSKPISGVAMEDLAMSKPFGLNTEDYLMQQPINTSSSIEEMLMGKPVNSEDYLMRQKMPFNSQMEDRIMGMPVQASPAPVNVPYATAESTAQQLNNNQSALQTNMNRYSKDEWEAMSRAERAEKGLPVRPIDALFAGYDSFRPLSELDRMKADLARLGVQNIDQFQDDGIRNMHAMMLEQIRRRRGIGG